jgi:kynureninase
MVRDARWLGDRIGGLLGAGRAQVCDTTSINLYKAIHAALALRPDRNVVIAEDASFPTDLYILEGAIKSAGRPIQRRLIGADGPSIEALLDRDVAVAVLSHVNYRTGELLDIAAITRQLHDAPRACAHWRAHLERFPKGRYGAEVLQARAALECGR